MENKHVDIQYKITFFSDWHCGSGLAAGADVDALVIKDKDGLPYIPGKTIKGLVREAVENILDFQKTPSINQERNFIETFGFFGEAEMSPNSNDGEEKELEKEKEAIKGKSFFRNAELSPDIKSVLAGQPIAKFLYKSLSSTAIDENGIAEKCSLRRTEVVVPCELEGTIMNVPIALKETIINSLKYIKRVGLNRNRGLGRCDIKVKGDEV